MSASAHKAKVVSLGCRLNIAESEHIRSLVENENVVVNNSCAVTMEAVRQTRQAIRRARRTRPDARLLVTGCAADIEREQLAAMPEVDGLIANEAKLDARAWNVPESEKTAPSKHTRAFIAVQNGCDHSCTFCVIPQGRGRSRSLTIAEVLREVESHLAEGAPEVVLTGVDVTSWGHDLSGKPPLGELVSAVLETFPQLQRLRMSSLDGIEIDPLLFELFAGEQRLMPHLHLSLQAMDDMVLKRMKRRHDRAGAARVIERIRSARPDAAIGADLIAGFPTETDAMFENTLAAVRDLEISHLHVFPYSAREGTPAAKMPVVPGDVAKARAQRLRDAGNDVLDRFKAARLGQDARVLVEKPGFGHDEHYVPVTLDGGVQTGEIATVSLDAVTDDGYRGTAA